MRRNRESPQFLDSTATQSKTFKDKIEKKLKATNSDENMAF